MKSQHEQYDTHRTGKQQSKHPSLRLNFKTTQHILHVDANNSLMVTQYIGKLYITKVSRKQPIECTKSWMAQGEMWQNLHKGKSTTEIQVMKESLKTTAL